MVVSKVEGEVSEALYKKRPGNPVRSERIDECEFGCDAAEFTAFILTHSNMVREFGVHIVKIVYVVGSFSLMPSFCVTVKPVRRPFW